MIQETEPRKPEETRKAAASLVLSLAAAAEHPDEFVTDVDDAMEQNLSSVSR